MEVWKVLLIVFAFSFLLFICILPLLAALQQEADRDGSYTRTRGSNYLE